MKLWFIGYNTRVIGNPANGDEAWSMIHAFCTERAFKVYYVRTWTENDATWYDVGSHAEFFVLADDNWSPPN